jgi:hypothetical protein
MTFICTMYYRNVRNDGNLKAADVAAVSSHLINIEPAMYKYHAALRCVYQCFVQITEDKPRKLYLYDHLTASPFTSQNRITFHVTCALNGYCY